MMCSVRRPKAQPLTKIPRIGILRQDAPLSRVIDDFRQGLHEFGYMEGQNLILELPRQMDWSKSFDVDGVHKTW
jgi:hypothetical protein